MLHCHPTHGLGTRQGNDTSITYFVWIGLCWIIPQSDDLFGRQRRLLGEDACNSTVSTATQNRKHGTQRSGGFPKKSLATTVSTMGSLRGRVLSCLPPWTLLSEGFHNERTKASLTGTQTYKACDCKTSPRVPVLLTS